MGGPDGKPLQVLQAAVEVLSEAYKQHKVLCIPAAILWNVQGIVDMISADRAHLSKHEFSAQHS